MTVSALAVTSGTGTRPAITERSSQRVTKVNDRVRVAITEAFRKLAGEEVAITKDDLHAWVLKRQSEK